jgi:hypothetical protein
VLNTYPKESIGRWTPLMTSIIENDPYWLDPGDPHVPVATTHAEQQGGKKSNAGASCR